MFWQRSAYHPANILQKERLVIMKKKKEQDIMAERANAIIKELNENGTILSVQKQLKSIIQHEFCVRWPENDAESTGKPKLNDVFVQIQYQGDDKFRLLVQYWVNYGGAYGMTQVSAIKTITAVNEPLGNIHVDMDIWVRSLLGNLIDSVSLLPEK